MAAKSIKLSDDNVTFYTLPGSSGEIANEAGLLPDTVFGQNFESNFPGLIDWTISADAIFKGFAGYVVGLKITGTPTGMTAEACSLVSGKTYEVTDTTKRILNRSSSPALDILDNGVSVAAANIESIDYLFGQVTFVAGYTPTTPITMTGEYLPATEIAGAKTFTLTQTANPIDESTIPIVKANDGRRVYSYGLKTVSLDISGVYASSNGFLANLLSRNEFILEINPDNSDLAVARGFFRFTTQGQSGNVGELEEETLAFTLSVPDDDKAAAPFSWNIEGASTISPAIAIAIASWQDGTPIYVQYLPDGLTGVTGDVIITDLSLAGGLESMNTFTVNMQGSDALTTV